MNRGSVGPGSIGTRPSPQDRCAECGEPVGEGWVRYTQNPDNPQSPMQHFGGIIRTGPVEPRADIPKRPIREFCYPEDLEVFFHTSCAPRIRRPEQLQEEIAEVFARAVVAGWERTVARWARVGQSIPGDSDPARCHAYVASVRGRRVFTMARADWERVRAHEGKRVEIDPERTPTGGVSESAWVIAGLAAECSAHAARIEVWRYNDKDRPRLKDIEEYIVLESLTRRLNLPMFAELAKAKDSPKLRSISVNMSSW